MIAKKPAPVVERSPEIARATKSGVGSSADQGPATYVVKRGDTLYNIALEHGLDHRDLARWNGITNPNSIEVGQVLRVRDPDASVALANARLGYRDTRSRMNRIGLYCREMKLRWSRVY